MADDLKDDAGGFLSRWSRRKAAAQRGVALPDEAPPVPTPAVVPTAPPAPVAATVATPAPEPSAPAEPPPTLDDVARLTKDSDFTRFVAPDVQPEVKNAAMKKLFASDPHFNTMDGLDVYIDDYNKFEPIPKQLLRQLVNARVLGLIDDELEEQPKPDNREADENADLQLQPNDAAGQSGAEPGIAERADPDDPRVDEGPLPS